MGDRRPETGDKRQRQKMGLQKTGDRRRDTGDGIQETGYRRQETGDGKQRRRETENGDRRQDT